MLSTNVHITDIEQKLNQLTGLPVPVRRWNVDIGEDATGLTAAWVWAVLDDSNINNRIAINRLREMIDSEVRCIAPNLDWVYVRFRALSEV